ncbi:MAG: DUF3137 domain-containing protein [Alphaproteobacteria bacterium]|nr:DUF3137 domain-containing protein [Alphaproteobacteria bacterium]
MNDFKGDSEYRALKSRFDIYYIEKLLPLLKEAEKFRSRYVHYFWTLFWLAAFFYPLILIWAFKTYNSPNSPQVGFAISLSALVAAAVTGPIYKYKKRAKNSGIMKEFASFFGTFEYEFEQSLPDDLLEYSHLFKSFTHNFGDDFFSGSFDDVGICIAEEKLQREIRTKKRRRKITVFKGICVLLDMNKPFVCRTVVLKDGGILNAIKRISGMQKVHLEDIYFEKIFEVFSDDQIEARYLLTTAFMERVLKLRDLFGGKSIQFSFFNDKLLFAIPTRKDMFEACSFFKTAINKPHVDLVFDQFYTVFSIIKILKLNQKIGM